VRPVVVVDRYRLVLRVREHGIVRPVRLAFTNPVRCPCDAKEKPSPTCWAMVGRRAEHLRHTG
jgi:hypothetical protein